MSIHPPQTRSTDEAARPSPASPVINAEAAESPRLADQRPAPKASPALPGDVASASSSNPDQPTISQGIRIPSIITYIPPTRPLSIHPAAAAYPINTTKFHELKADIAVKGVLKAIIVVGNTVIDGVQRWTCCRELGIDCPASEMSLDHLNGVHIVDFVRSLNEQTRHLTKSQYAMVAARSREPYVAAAKLRRASGGAKHCRDNSREHTDEVGDVRTILSKIFGIGENIYDCAVAVLDSGCNELITAVEDGKLSAFPAAEVAALPEPKRGEAIVIAANGNRKALRPYLAKPADQPKAANLKPLGDTPTTSEPSSASSPKNSSEHVSQPECSSSAIDTQPDTPLRANNTRYRPMNQLQVADHSSSPATVRAHRPATASGLLCTARAATSELAKLKKAHSSFATIVLRPDWKEISADELASVPIPQVARTGAVVVLWAPPNIEPAFQVLNAWGLRFVETIVAVGDRVNGKGFFYLAHRIALIGTLDTPHFVPPRVIGSWCGQNGEAVEENIAHHTNNFGEMFPAPRLRVFGPRDGRLHHWQFAACLPDPNAD